MSKRQKTTDDCPDCKGTGINPDTEDFRDDCPACNGSGRAPADMGGLAAFFVDMGELDPDDEAKLSAGTHYLDANGYIRPKLVQAE